MITWSTTKELFLITIQDNHPDNLILNFAYNDRLGLSLPALGDEDRKNMFAAMDENGDGDHDYDHQHQQHHHDY